MCGVFESFPKLSKFGRAHLISSILMALIVCAMEGAIAGVFLNQIDINQTAGTVGPQCNATNITLTGSQTSSSSSCVSSATNYSNNSRSIIVYLIIFVMAQVFQFYIVLDALWQQNTDQIFMHVLFVIAELAYSIVQYFQLRDLVNPANVCPAVNVYFKNTFSLSDWQSSCNPGCTLFQQMIPFITVNIAILAFFTIVYSYLAFKLYLEFGWKIYKRIGAAPEMRLMYRAFHIFIMLLKLDFFFFEAFAIQFLYLVLKSGDPEYGLTIAVIVLALFIVIAAYYIECYENTIGMVCWIIILLGLVAYYLFKIARIWTQTCKYSGSGKFLTLFAALGVMVTALSLLLSLYCWRNFGKGLKPYLTNSTDSGAMAMGEKEGDGRQRTEI